MSEKSLREFKDDIAKEAMETLLWRLIERMEGCDRLPQSEALKAVAEWSYEVAEAMAAARYDAEKAPQK